MYKESFGYDLNVPENIRELLMWLCQDVASLYDKWDFYLELFSTKENTELLSELAVSSFQIIEESIRNDLIMMIGRLSDPSNGKRNLSIETLIQNCDKIESSEIELLKEFKEKCRPVRKLRHKFVAHNDLKSRIKPKDNPLPGIGLDQVKKIIHDAGTLLNLVYQKYVNAELGFDIPIQIGGAKDLLYWLKKAKENQKKDVSEI